MVLKLIYLSVSLPLFWGLSLLVITNQAGIKKLLEYLHYFFCFYGLYFGDSKKCLRSLEIHKIPTHLCIGFEKSPGRRQIESILEWCRILHIQQVSFYCPFGFNFPTTGEAAFISKDDYKKDYKYPTTKLEILGEGCSLYLFVGRSLRTQGVPLKFVALSELYYLGTTLNIVKFCKCLKNYSLSEQRNGK